MKYEFTCEMNLSHTVRTTCYSLYQAMSATVIPTAWTPAQAAVVRLNSLILSLSMVDSKTALVYVEALNRMLSAKLNSNTEAARRLLPQNFISETWDAIDTVIHWLGATGSKAVILSNSAYAARVIFVTESVAKILVTLQTEIPLSEASHDGVRNAEVRELCNILAEPLANLIGA